MCANFLSSPLCSDRLRPAAPLRCEPVDLMRISQVILLCNVSSCTCWAIHLVTCEAILSLLALSCLRTRTMSVTCRYLSCLRAYISSYFVSNINHINSLLVLTVTAVTVIRPYLISSIGSLYSLYCSLCNKAPVIILSQHYFLYVKTVSMNKSLLAYFKRHVI